MKLLVFELSQTNHFLQIVLNKVDLLPPNTREASVQKMMKKMKATLSKTKFKDAPIVTVAAKCGGSDDQSTQIESIGELEKNQNKNNLN